MTFELKKSARRAAKIRLSLQGPAGSGKTMSALLIAYGLTSDWNKIAVVDTERGSANLYSHLGDYYVLALEEPFSPERYMEALKVCEGSGIECIILDSISHEWSGPGGCLEIHEKTTSAMKVPNSFTAWASVTPRHQAFIDSILQSKSHVITTIRSKTEYIIGERNGRQVPQKIGMAAVQRDGYEYEVTISLDIDEEHNALSSKDRTGLFSSKGKFRITVDTGKLIKEWTEQGISQSELEELILRADSVEELNQIYKSFPDLSQQLIGSFSRRKNQLQANLLSKRQNFNNNGNGITLS